MLGGGGAAGRRAAPKEVVGGGCMIRRGVARCGAVWRGVAWVWRGCGCKCLPWCGAARRGLHVIVCAQAIKEEILADMNRGMYAARY